MPSDGVKLLLKDHARCLQAAWIFESRALQTSHSLNVRNQPQDLRVAATNPFMTDKVCASLLLSLLFQRLGLTGHPGPTAKIYWGY